MKLFARRPSATASPTPTSGDGARDNANQPDDATNGPQRPIPGDRGIPSIHRARSIQSRMSSMFAFALMLAIGVGLLSWYYAGAWKRPQQARDSAQAAARTRAEGETTLPSLGRIEPPTPPTPKPASPTPPRSPSLAEQVLGPAPEPPIIDARVASIPPIAQPAPPLGQPPYGPGNPPEKTPGELAFERRLAGPVFRAAGDNAMSMQASPAATNVANPSSPPNLTAGASTDRDMQALLRPTVTTAVRAQVLPTQRLLLPRGAFIDCTLETAIDSSLPGLTTCITATDTFSADGRVVLLERGTKLVGETRGEVQQGSARLFVLWTQARTPTGVIVPLDSPGTDELGRSGLSGQVNRHFWDRFGAAILVSVIDGAVQGAAQSAGADGTVIVNPSSSSEILTEVLKSTIHIPPTIVKPQGDRIQILVARDLDFRSVYELRPLSNPTRSSDQ